MSRSSTTTEETSMAKRLPPIHPGEILLHDFMEPMGITSYRLSQDIDVPPQRIADIVAGKRAITADTALRLRHNFTPTDGTSPRGQERYATTYTPDPRHNTDARRGAQ